MKTETLIGKIVEIIPPKVTLKILVGNEFQVRKFDIEPFKGSVTLKLNQMVEINIETKPGERRFTYKNSDVGFPKELTNIFGGLKTSKFFKT